MKKRKDLPVSLVWCKARVDGMNAGVLVAFHSKRVYGTWRCIGHGEYTAFGKNTIYLGTFSSARSARRAVEADWAKGA